MNILCLEQGDWMKPEEYPGMRNDWELSQLGDFASAQRTRAARRLSVNDSASPIQTSMFNAVGGSTIMYAATSRAFTRGTSGSRRWTGSPTTGPSTTSASHPSTTSTRT